MDFAKRELIIFYLLSEEYKMYFRGNVMKVEHDVNQSGLSHFKWFEMIVVTLILKMI